MPRRKKNPENTPSPDKPPMEAPAANFAATVPTENGSIVDVSPSREIPSHNAKEPTPAASSPHGAESDARQLAVMLESN